MKNEASDYIVDYCCISEPGRVRMNNEDNFLCAGILMPMNNTGTKFPVSGRCNAFDAPVFGVFDGMGGEAEGERAAFITADLGSKYSFAPAGCEALRDYTLEANRRVCAYMKQTGCSSMGSTEALLQFHPEAVSLCNLGDSKILRWRDGVLTQLSEDHLLDNNRGEKTPLLQYLGIPETEMLLQPYLTSLTPRIKDRYLLCTDGLTDMVSFEEIAEDIALQKTDIAAQSMVNRALKAGGRDNITLILCEICTDEEKCDKKGAGKENRFSRLLKRLLHFE